tara:strand:+ start:91 stop:723 length:633 start_codon:yes stop_codon:yes gene_type:complete
MPNWCWNHLEVTGDEIQLREFVEKSTINIEKNDEFTFNGTYPMPEDLNITKGTQTQDEKEQAILNKAKYGYTDWYDWRCEEWGTKWDACEAHVDHNDIDYFAVSFETAWSPPIAWIDNIMKDFPDLCFTLEYEEPGMCFGGRLSAQYEVIWDDLHWDLDQASECCEAEVSFDEEGFHGEAKCLICEEETETISMNANQIRPAKIKINESK